MAKTPRGGMLPIAGQRSGERADAARNRRKILEAASRLISETGPEHLSLDEVADAAQVGVGTVYRRFGDRAGLVQALLDQRERELQRAFMQGPPPLGPGAPARERIRSFLHALVDRVEEQSDLVLIAETAMPAMRYADGPYPLRHQHLVTLLTELRPDSDVGYLAHALLAPCAASLLLHQRRNEGRTVAELKSGIDELLNFVGVH